MLKKSFCISHTHSFLSSRIMLVQNGQTWLTWAPPLGFGAPSTLARMRWGGSVSTGFSSCWGCGCRAASWCRITLAAGPQAAVVQGEGHLGEPTCSFLLQYHQGSSFSSAQALHTPVTPPGAPSLAPPDPFQDGWEDGGFKVMSQGNVKIAPFGCPNAWPP